jgi:hypothetical protein
VQLELISLRAIADTGGGGLNPFAAAAAAASSSRARAHATDGTGVTASRDRAGLGELGGG